MISLSCFLLSLVCLAHSTAHSHRRSLVSGAAFCHGKANGNYRDPNNCFGFIMCSNSFTYKMDCPENLKYNAEKDYCDHPENVECGQGEIEGPGCQEGSTSYDECGQRCTCVGGRLQSCVRIRKEFTSLTDAERKRHIDTILEVSAEGGDFREDYEDLINEHFKLFDQRIHVKDNFLPWHRDYILRYENLMRKVDCTFTVTYWDWSLDSREPFSTGADNVWNSETGFGGDGEGAENCVMSGPFESDTWSRVRPESPTDEQPDCLARDFNERETLPREAEVMSALNIPVNNFHDFEETVRGTLHNNVHCRISGTMCSEEAASAPEFFLHHTFIDKIWDDWQKKSSAHKNAYFPMVPNDMPGTDLKPAALMDLSNQPGGVMVEYEPFKPEEAIRKKLAGLTPSQLRDLPRKPFNGIGPEAIRLFKISRAEVRKIRRLEKLLNPKVIQPKCDSA